MAQFILLVSIGFAVGTLGTLIGAGGGFILMPVLLLLYPDENPELLTSISLAVVFFNALSGSIAYARMKRIDYKSGILFSIATIPGAILGSMTTAYIPRYLFNIIFGLVMVCVSLFLLFNPDRKNRIDGRSDNHYLDPDSVPPQYNKTAGVVLSLFVGYISSVLGIGGGIIHVPALIHILHFPVHIATATSHFILAVMSLTGTSVHIARGVFSHGLFQTVSLSIGALAGAQLGARFSNHIHGRWILWGLALALAFVGIRLIAITL